MRCPGAASEVDPSSSAEPVSACLAMAPRPIHSISAARAAALGSVFDAAFGADDGSGLDLAGHADETVLGVASSSAWSSAS